MISQAWMDFDSVVRRWWRHGLPLALALTTACETMEPPPEPIRPVRYEPVAAAGEFRVRTFSGSARSAVEAPISFRVGGTVTQVDVAVGDRVRAGDLIATVDPTDYELELERAEASLESAKAEERNAAANFARMRGLYENNNASKNDYDAARAASESADANVRAFAKQVELARTHLGYTRLFAPADGAIASVPVEVNQNVTAGQTVVNLMSGSRVEVRVAVPEMLITGVRAGDDVIVTFDALPDRSFRGTVTEVGVTSTDFATTFPVTVRVDEETPEIRSGMAAVVGFRFVSSKSGPRFVVPSFAVGEDRGGRFVFVAVPTRPGFGRIERRPVEVGELTDAGLEILSGVAKDELLVTAGVSRLIDGQEVKLPGHAAAATDG